MPAVRQRKGPELCTRNRAGKESRMSEALDGEAVEMNTGARKRAEVIANTLYGIRRESGRVHVELPWRNPLTEAGVSDEEWLEAKWITEQKHREDTRNIALTRIERYWKEARFLEGESVEQYADSVELEDLEELAEIARAAAIAYAALADGLERSR